MPDIKIYVPDDMYYRLKKTKNRSKLIQDLLTEHWQKENDHRKKEKKKDVIASEKGVKKEFQNSIRNPRTPSHIVPMVRGL